MEPEGLLLYTHESTGRDGIVGKVTCYELDSPGSKSQWGRDFPHLYRPAVGPTQPPKQWVLGLSWVLKWLGHSFEHLLPSGAKVKERVEL
jgi:hypothetical protein